MAVLVGSSVIAVFRHELWITPTHAVAYALMFVGGILPACGGQLSALTERAFWQQAKKKQKKANTQKTRQRSQTLKKHSKKHRKLQPTTPNQLFHPVLNPALILPERSFSKPKKEQPTPYP